MRLTSSEWKEKIATRTSLTERVANLRSGGFSQNYGSGHYPTHNFVIPEYGLLWPSAEPVHCAHPECRFYAAMVFRTPHTYTSDGNEDFSGIRGGNVCRRHAWWICAMLGFEPVSDYPPKSQWHVTRRDYICGKCGHTWWLLIPKGYVAMNRPDICNQCRTEA